ncbi:MAG: SDR family NAD(P)-dependent oxidoreductase [Planctomycetota bacterium]|jgi:NAD(P)-dependent dehydrogenase (short-subunit alcohol dehydrogenase family)
MLKDKIAFVTGGSGDVGEAIVKVLARENCKVAFSYNKGQRKAEALEENLKSSGFDVKSYCLDVTDSKASSELSNQIEDKIGPVDILVNNAGIAQVMPFAMIEEKDWDELMDVNVKGMFLVTKAFARSMIRRKTGSIVNIGSLAGMRMLEVPVHYAAAKSAAVGFTIALARELGRYNIRVNAVAPGMLEGGVSINIPAKQQEQYKSHCALSRAGSCGEVAELVAFLASDRSSYINAQSILVDGGI